MIVHYKDMMKLICYYQKAAMWAEVWTIPACPSSYHHFFKI